MLTGYGMLLVLGLGGAGLLPAARDWWRSRTPPRHVPRPIPPARLAPRVEWPEPLRARGLTKSFGSLVALDHVDLDVAPGRVHALIGPNGSGKTTALKALVGELVPEEGTVRVNGTELTGPPRARVLQGVVGTQQATAVFPELTALQNALVGAGLRLEHDGPFRTVFRTPKARADERLAEQKALGALQLVGLHDPDRPARS